MTMRRFIFIFIFFFASVCFGYDDIAGQKKFVSSLFSERRYFDCITETRRLAFMENKSGSLDYEYFILSNYFFARQYLTVIEQINSHPKYFNEFNFKLMLADSLVNCNRNSDVPKLLSEYWTSVNTSTEKRFEYLKLLVKAELLTGNFEKAYNLTNEFYALSKFNESKQLWDDLKKYSNVQYKNAVMSSILSAIIPGAGQIYSQKYFDGIISFLSIAACSAGGLYLYKREEKGYAFTLFAFSGLFYAGNIYGAYNAALNFNVTSKNNFAGNVINTNSLNFNPAKYYSPEIKTVIDGR